MGKLGLGLFVQGTASGRSLRKLYSPIGRDSPGGMAVWDPFDFVTAGDGTTIDTGSLRQRVRIDGQFKRKSILITKMP